MLFRPDDNPAADDNFKNHEIELYRYFDLDEETKSDLTKTRALIPMHGENDRRVSRSIDAIHEKLKEKKQLRLK